MPSDTLSSGADSSGGLGTRYHRLGMDAANREAVVSPRNFSAEARPRLLGSLLWPRCGHKPPLCLTVVVALVTSPPPRVLGDCRSLATRRFAAEALVQLPGRFHRGPLRLQASLERCRQFGK